MGELIGRVLLGLAINTVVLVVAMHFIGKMWGIDFGPVGAAVKRVIVFLLVTSLVSALLGIVAWPINLVIYIVAFMWAFHLDAWELMVFTVSYSILSTIIGVFLAMALH